MQFGAEGVQFPILAGTLVSFLGDTFSALLHILEIKSDIRLLLAGLREYSGIEALTPEVVNKIIKRIEVHNSGMVNGHKRVGVDIYFTGVGLVDLATIKEMLAIAESSRP